MPDPTPRPDDDRPQGQDPVERPAGDPGERSAEDHAAGTGGGPGPEGLTVEDILDTPQSADAESADRAAAQDAQLAEERLEELRRLQAEFVNFKHRTAREKEQLRTFVTADLLQSLLPVFDDVDAARRAGDLAEGPFAAIANKLEEILQRQGMSRIGVVGEQFDPAVHEAILQQPTSAVEPDRIAMVLRSGFKVGERLVRAAQVAVAVAE